MEDRTWFTSRQEQLLRLVGKNRNFASSFYLTGGTALAAGYYNHRYSEDLDFFSPKEFNYADIANLIFSSKKELGWKVVLSLKTNVNGFKIVWDDQDELLIDFVYYSFPRIAKGKDVFGVYIDSIKDICANKFETILLRSKARDYVDLYTLMNHEKYNFDEVEGLYLKKYETKIENLEIVRALLRAREVNDYPKMKSEFDKEKMIEFFEDEAKKFESKIFKK